MDEAGLTLASFEALVNGLSDMGADEEELGRIVRVLELANDQAKDRRELLAELFRACNSSGSGIILSQEMRAFAETMGFGGTDFEWRQAFVEMLADFADAGSTGFNFTAFEALVSEKTSKGLYCSEQDVKVALKKLAKIKEDAAREEILTLKAALQKSEAARETADDEAKTRIAHLQKALEESQAQIQDLQDEVRQLVQYMTESKKSRMKKDES